MPTRAGARVSGHRANRPLVARGRAAAGDEGLRLCPGARVGHTVCLGSLGSSGGRRSESDFGDIRLKGVLGSGVQVRAGASVPLPRPPSRGLVGLHQPLPRRMGSLATPQLPLLSPRGPSPRSLYGTKGRPGRKRSAARPAIGSGLLGGPLYMGSPKEREMGEGLAYPSPSPQAAWSSSRLSAWIAEMGRGPNLTLLPSPRPRAVSWLSCPWHLHPSLSCPEPPLSLHAAQP